MFALVTYSASGKYFNLTTVIFDSRALTNIIVATGLSIWELWALSGLSHQLWAQFLVAFLRRTLAGDGVSTSTVSPLFLFDDLKSLNLYSANCFFIHLPPLLYSPFTQSTNIVFS